MTISPQRAKWILALVCLVLAFCLVQRSFNLPTQPEAVISASAASHSNSDDAGSSDKPCSLSAKSLNAAAPLLDTALPFLLLLLALIATLFQPTAAAADYRRDAIFPPLRRRHLTLCVFRE